MLKKYRMSCLPTATYSAPGVTLYGGGGSGGGSNFDVASISSLTVSSINGAAPGGSAFFSTFLVDCAQSASTILMELPAGTWSYNGLLSGGGSSAYLNGFVNVAADSVPNYYASLFPPQFDNTQGAGVFPAAMTLNFGDSALSTIKLIVANNSGSTDATFVGGVFKLN
jgi:hypothetical protein